VPALSDAFRATATLRNLGGDNSGKGGGCPGADDRSSLARRHYHHLTFYGFMLCFASTSTGTLYHYVLGREAPYGYLELPVILGTVGGVMLCVGTAGLWREKRRMEPAVRSLARLGMDYAFIWLLFWVSATGLILLAVRETGYMGLALAVHLGVVYAFFLVLPFSKFVHAIYRFAALLADAGEARRSAM
jgi:citrate/tricarballylate utilization protein